MTTPEPTVNREKLLEGIERSGLVAPDRLQQIIGETSHTDSPKHIVDHLVASGDLTRFQGKKLLVGQGGGLLLGKYRILSPLGRGGSGVVYLAKEHALEGNLVRPLLALKILPPKKALEERVRDRFQREMVIGQYIPPHPHLPRVFDTGEVNGISYIAMEYAPGRTIKEMVTEDGPLSHGDAARIFADIADALAALHSVGLIHRDIKPSNVIVSPSGSAKLIDFGFALLATDDLPRDRALVGGRGYILGSMDYIAPEQAADATDVSARSDLYSLGATMYYAVSGCPPFPGGTALQKIRWHRHDSPPPIRTIRSDIPNEFAAVITKLMAKQPDERYSSATHASGVLRQWATMPTITPSVRLVPNVSEPSTDDVVIDDSTEPASREWESDERPVASIPHWAPWAVLAALFAFFLIGYLLKLIAG